MDQRVSCHPLTMDTWVGRICGRQQVLFPVLQFSLISAITPTLHQLCKWQHIYINTTVQITMFNNPNTPKEDQVSTGRLQLYVQIQFFWDIRCVCHWARNVQHFEESQCLHVQCPELQQLPQPKRPHWNRGNNISNMKASQHRRSESSATSLWEPQMSHNNGNFTWEVTLPPVQQVLSLLGLQRVWQCTMPDLLQLNYDSTSVQSAPGLHQ